MRTRIDERLIEQVAQFKLRFTCEHCGHFDEQARACSLGYPDEPHQTRTLEPDSELVFCKEFDLV